MNTKIVVCGSLAYDRIMVFPGRFADHILPEKIHVLSVSFTVDGVQERLGGTAGNIAYALSLLGQKAEISASVGRDHQAYFKWLDENGISTGGIRIVEDELTASCYITTDQADNQITGFNPGAMKYSSCLDFSGLNAGETVVIISPGNIDDMHGYPDQCKARGIGYIFDPGQSLPMMDPRKLTKAIDGCRILICNDYELDLITSMTGLSKNDLGGLAGNIIVTRGEAGSVLTTPAGEMDIPAVKPRAVVDPTGAGDAYRGGMISGIVQGLDIEHSARMGSVCASFAVECRGTQDYRFTLDEFNGRLRGCC